jgi:hypothetical protein
MNDIVLHPRILRAVAQLLGSDAVQFYSDVLLGKYGAEMSFSAPSFVLPRKPRNIRNIFCGIFVKTGSGQTYTYMGKVETKDTFLHRSRRTVELARCRQPGPGSSSGLRQQYVASTPIGPRGKKTHFWRHFALLTIILARQLGQT